jgi:hypothetical protein
MRRPFGLAAVIGVLAGIMVATPVASAKILVGQSSDGITLGETQAQVQQQFGPHVCTFPTRTALS